MILAAVLLCADDFDIALRAGAWVAEVRGGVTASKRGVTGTRLDVDSLLDLGTTAAPIGGLDVHLYDRLSAFAEYWDAQYRGTGAFAATQAYGGTIFPAGSAVTSRVAMSTATVGLQYAFEIPLDRDTTLFLSPVGTLRYFDYHGTLASGAARASDGFNFLTPAFGVRLDFEFPEDVRVDVGATWMSIDSLWQRRVDVIDGRAAVAWQFWEGGYVEAGYRYNRIDIRDKDGSSRRVDVDVEMTGPFVEMGFRF